MSRDIYPGYGREGSFCHMYCEIAMESYYRAMQAHARIKAENYSAYENTDYKAMNKSIISTVVFSSMAIESFLNDYAAACLGDDEFYDNFDRLSVLSKFQLITKFIMHTPIDKGQAYYSLLKSLFSRRDRFVHNKSYRMEFQGYPEEQMNEIEQEWLSEEMPTFDVEDIRKDMKMGLDALKAIQELARFFDERDQSISAQFRFFWFDGWFLCEGTLSARDIQITKDSAGENIKEMLRHLLLHCALKVRKNYSERLWQRLRSQYR